VKQVHATVGAKLAVRAVRAMRAAVRHLATPSVNGFRISPCTTHTFNMKHDRPDTESSAASALGATSVCLILVSMGLVAAGGWPWFQKFLENSAPVWVQAVGSIAVVLAAVHVGRSQIAADRAIERSRLAEDSRRRVLVIDALLAAFEAAVGHAKEHFDKYPGMPMYQFFIDLMKTRSDALAKIDLFECPASVIEPLLLLFPSPAAPLTESLLSYAKSFDDLQGNPKSHLPRIDNSFTVTQGLVRVARAACKAALEEGLTEP
jgi:hypothetical protein